MIFQTLNDKIKVTESKPKFILSEKHMCITGEIELIDKVDCGSSPVSETPHNTPETKQTNLMTEIKTHRQYPHQNQVTASPQESCSSRVGRHNVETVEVTGDQQALIPQRRPHPEWKHRQQPAKGQRSSQAGNWGQGPNNKFTKRLNTILWQFKPDWSNRNTMWAMQSNFKSSSSYVFKKQNFNHIFCLTQYAQNTIIQYM